MKAAHAGWIVSGSDNAVYACLDFMALRVPVIAERTPLTQHYRRRSHHRQAFDLRRSRVHRVVGGRVSRQS